MIAPRACPHCGNPHEFAGLCAACREAGWKPCAQCGVPSHANEPWTLTWNGDLYCGASCARMSPDYGR